MNDELNTPIRETLEVGEDLVKENLSRKRYFLHGNSSPADSENIAKQGLEVTEGRATVSCNLVHAFIWASSVEKRKAYSLSTTPTNESSEGSVFVIEKPKQYSFGFGYFTNYEVDIEKKVVSGQPIKWASAYKQIGIFSTQDVEEKREQLEAIPKDIRSNSKLTVNPTCQLNPSEQISEVLQELEFQAKNFKQVDMQNAAEMLNNKLNLKPEMVIELIKSTIESITITRLRRKALEIKAAQGYTIHNYANKPAGRFNKAPEKIKEELLEWQSNLTEDGTLGIDWLDEYASTNIEHFLEELER
jgi:hypothetical protein